MSNLIIFHITLFQLHACHQMEFFSMKLCIKSFAIKINKVCQTLELPIITPAEMQLLSFVKHVSTAIDIPQGDIYSCYLGQFLPNIKSLMTNYRTGPHQSAFYQHTRGH